jgi:hypothetical protein
MNNMIRLTTFIPAIGFIGCGQREQQSAVVVPPVLAVENAITNPQPQIPETKAIPKATLPEAPREFEYPADLTGKAVERAVTPETPPLTPTERFGLAPLPRILPSKTLNPESTIKMNNALPPILPAKSSGVTIVPPHEQVPFDLGRGADLVPAKPTLPISAPIVERARDVNLPPAMPTLGRLLNERVSLEDPTSDFANGAIVSRAVNVPLASAEFVRVALPDPFELGEQVKPKVPPAADPGLTPVTVNPQRVK